MAKPMMAADPKKASGDNMLISVKTERERDDEVSEIEIQVCATATTMRNHGLVSIKETFKKYLFKVTCC